MKTRSGEAEGRIDKYLAAGVEAREEGGGRGAKMGRYYESCDDAQQLKPKQRSGEEWCQTAKKGGLRKDYRTIVTTRPATEEGGDAGIEFGDGVVS